MKGLTAKNFLLAAAVMAFPLSSHAGAVCTWLYSLDQHSDATLVQSTNGTLYGTTAEAVIDNGGIPFTRLGSIFEASTNGIVGPYVYDTGVSNIFSFTSSTTAQPNAGVIFGSAGTPTGTTAFCGRSNTLFPSGMGGVYSCEFTPPCWIRPSSELSLWQCEQRTRSTSRRRQSALDIGLDGEQVSLRDNL